MKSKLSKTVSPKNKLKRSRDNINVTQFYCELLIRIRRQPVRPVESCSDAPFSVTECKLDETTIISRCQNEGIQFLTEQLPSLGKALDRALLGDSDAFANTPFKKAIGSKLPIFLGDLLRRVFDADGTVRSDACGQSVRLLRQLAFSYYKLSVPYAQSKNDSVIDGFIKVDEDLPTWFETKEEEAHAHTPKILRTFALPNGEACHLEDAHLVCVQVARYIIATTMGSLDPLDIQPRHGPGVVATGEKLWDKTHFSTIIERLDRVYPFMEYMKFNLDHVCDTWDEALDSVEYGTAKVVLVPKDSRGPRLISCEPLNNQWIQQGQMALMVKRLESHPLTRGQVNFTDQRINGALALQSSKDGKYATLDMKDASDRVSWALVELLFPEHWKEALFASRSARTLLPNGRIVKLKKFAPMGSAVCFPVEALIFYALSVGAVYSKQIRLTEGSLAHSFAHRIRIDRKRVQKIARTIFVYGDDLICRTEDCGSLRAYLESFALRFNDSKCCMSGLFRESCGVDAWNGIDVTPVRFRTHIRSSLATPEAYVSWVEYSNSLYARGLWLAADYIATCIQAVRPTATLYTPDTGRTSRKGGVFLYRPYPGSSSCNKRRYNQKTQSWEALSWLVVPAKAQTTNLGWNELLRVYSQRNGSFHTEATSGDGNMAGVYAVPRRYKLVRGWVSIDANQ